jgi:RHS repeat-associated protein
MAGTTVNPYRFGGQVGYRRDTPSRQYVRARHLDTAKGRWISRDPIPIAATDFNPFCYAKNNPASLTDPSGLRPDPGAGTLVRCPAAVGVARDNLCNAVRRVGTPTIAATNCCTHTGSKSHQADCLLKWCNGPGKVYCIKPGTGDCTLPTKTTGGTCAFDYNDNPGTQQSDLNVYLCYPYLIKDPGCGVGTCGVYGGNILHELMHVCGSAQGGGYPDPDPAQNRAVCLCPTLGNP